MQVLLVHAAVACVSVHTLPQAPQLSTSVVVATSQPSAGLPLQSAKPAPQDGEHFVPELPVVQLVVPCALVHLAPQAPQLSVLSFRLVSQPSLTRLLQSPKPEVQVMEHTPALHEGMPLVVLHATRQLPQCWTLLSVSVSQLGSDVSQFAKAPVQDASPQTPSLHTCVAVQAAPQAPQFFASEDSSFSQPLLVCLSQFS